MINSPFEISSNKTVYFGEFHFEGNRLIIDSCVTYDNEGVELPVPEEVISNEVYPKLEIEKADEKFEYLESLDLENRYSLAEDRADENRKGYL